MGLTGITLVETWTRDFEATCREADEVVIGGGPLMELQSLDQMLFAFIEARKRQAPARIEGCGIGPVSAPIYERIVSTLLRLSSHTDLRDADAASWARVHAPECVTNVVEDPAVTFVKSVATGRAKPPTSLVPLVDPADKAIACFLRDWPVNYRGSVSEEHFPAVRQQFDAELHKLLLELHRRLEAPVHFLPMNCFVEGGDDRILGRKLSKALRVAKGQETTDECDFRPARLPASPWQIIDAMVSAKFCVCMRFHSVVFAETLGVPYLAVDYTNNGKIGAFLRERGREDRLLPISSLASGHWMDHLALALRALLQQPGPVIIPA
jgi:polysaccharide pyruvyl transferase WcaK-like protein